MPVKAVKHATTNPRDNGPNLCLSNEPWQCAGRFRKSPGTKFIVLSFAGEALVTLPSFGAVVFAVMLSVHACLL